ncbi:Zn2/Cys6 DNA-binding protein [Glarea lozoyensis ATCC 20868]|uniref:Zn2/Cys6 DNA-binding protein n=1 Tax=Glarea lozoyensis (strain ATCC 20868 / MF5171) TaxID=1116229 RepID=S3DB50_GLAL2|nr:Zn2/Cys6 DNA-binding protein [Glarea lozoyensis ATCC 20868]EPE34970.1 Zn2/Cys6 DNA-binding protein [Glarea lozoyensis ATCC 20868]
MGDRTENSGEVKVRKTRASKPKVKTGCQTCKIRRVKCDETKPACLRCVKFGHQCDGYINKNPTKPSSGSPTSGSRVLVPKSPSGGVSPVIESNRAYARDGSSSSPRLSGSDRPMPKLYPAPAPERGYRDEGLRQHPVQITERQAGGQMVTGNREAEAFERFCTATIPPTSASYAVSRHTWMSVVSTACRESEEISKAVVMLGNFGEAGGREWGGVGTLKHFREWRDEDGCMKASKAWSVGNSRQNSTDTNSLPSWRDQEEEETGALGREVVIGLRCLREWAYKQQAQQHHRDDGVIAGLAKSLETRALLYALQISCDARDRERGRDDEGSGDEMEM